MKRYPNLRSEKNRHGVPVFYYREDSGPRVRLPSPDARGFEDAYRAAKAHKPIPHVRDMPKSKVESRKQRTERALVQRLRSCRNRRGGKLGFDLTLGWLLEQAEKQNFCCALTGIEFFAGHASKGKKDPYVPSIDRIDPAKGYTTDNVRLVVFAVNSMLLDWGEDVFTQVANSYRYHRQGKVRQQSAGPVMQAAAPVEIIYKNNRLEA